MEIYLHGSGEEELHLVEVKAGDRIATAITEKGEVWLEGADEPLDPKQTFKQAGIGERAHLHVSTCRRVEVSVRYGGPPAKSEEFPPGTTFAAVFAWATGKKAFDLTKAEQAKHTFAVCDSDVQPDRSAHVGSFASECKLCLDLAPKERFEG